MAASAAVDELMALFDAHGEGDYAGEAVSQRAHALQAARCAADSGAADAVIAAALLHDVGHMIAMGDPSLPRMGPGGALGAVAHEAIGGSFLRGLGLPDETWELVSEHVQAKRYLTWKSPVRGCWGCGRGRGAGGGAVWACYWM